MIDVVKNDATAPPPGDALVEQVLDFDAIFARYMAKNVKTWKHDRSLTVGASEIFDCLRKVWFQKRGAQFGYEPDDEEDSWGATERGNIIENSFVVPGITAGLEGTNLSLHFAGGDQDTLVLDKNSATPDGLITGLKPGPLTVRAGGHVIEIDDIGADCIALEIKSIDPRATLLEERAKHHGQSQTQLGLMRELTSWKPLYAIVLYVDASFLDKFTPFAVQFDPNIYAAAKQRAVSVWQVDDPMMVVPEGKFDKACDHCRWRGACTEAILSAIPADSKGSDPTIVAAVQPLVHEFLDLKDDAIEAERKLAGAKERMKEFLLDAGVRKIAGNAWGISWFPVKGKSSVDLDALTAAGIDLSKYQRTGLGHDTLTVQRKAEKAVKVKKAKVSS